MSTPSNSALLERIGGKTDPSQRHRRRDSPPQSRRNSADRRFLSKDESLHIEACERICDEFGGEFLRVPSHDIGQAIVETAQKYRISQIVMGESKKSRWQILLKGSLTHRILFLLKQVDVHIISTSKETEEAQSKKSDQKKAER